ncbi:MAG: DUF2169 domain-containing protein [Pedobacter sp.]
MSHPEIDNQTPFAFEPLFLADEEARPLLVLVIKATFTIHDKGPLTIAEEQVPVNLTGELWGEPDKSSYKYEPESAFIKPATDVALIGSAYAPAVGATDVNVVIRVGPIEKVVRIIGDRYWIKALGVISMTKAMEFERIPLIYERVFGGWNRSNPDPEKHTFEPRNPVGTGFMSSSGSFKDAVRLPNLEDPKFLIKNNFDIPPPAGVGFISPHWQPRASYAGTYDSVWQKQRMPLLPKDFNRRFFNAASPGLTAPGFLSGNESVILTNVTKNGRLSFNLPGVCPPDCRVQLRGRNDYKLKTQLDTVIINTDENLLFLLWRSNITLRTGPQDVVTIEILA